MPEILLNARQDAAAFVEARMIRTTVNTLFGLMRARFKDFPNNYLVFDVETTGVKFGEDLVAQLGYVLVRDRRPVDQGQVYLDWTREPAVDQAWLKKRVESTRRHVETKDGRPTGRTYKVSYEDMRRGMKPADALQRYFDLFLANRADGGFFVAHNGYHFDAKWIEEHFSTFIGERFRFDDFELFDTGMIEKGAQAAMCPWVGESVRDYSLRVSRIWLKGVFWSLDGFCVPKYKLDEKMNTKTADAHDAAVDCLLTHALFEEHRREAEGVTCPPKP